MQYSGGGGPAPQQAVIPPQLVPGTPVGTPGPLPTPSPGAAAAALQAAYAAVSGGQHPVGNQPPQTGVPLPYGQMVALSLAQGAPGVPGGQSSSPLLQALQTYYAQQQAYAQQVAYGQQLLNQDPLYLRGYRQGA